MVTISNYFLRQNSEGKQFVTLELTGDVEAIQSAETGRFYLTAKKCSLSSTFSEDIAKSLVGKQMPGRIERVQVEPYDFTIKETGEVISLTHSYVYVPEEREEMLLSKRSNVLVGA